jgi:predicted aldo/keto reductase-like oxidoreductase
MKYRKFGKLDWEASALGFGAMRLPIIDDDSSNINEPEAIRMIRYSIDNGVNYVDTAYPYHGGQSEIIVGKALKDGYRDKVRLATKMPSWLINSYDDFDRYLDEQLEKLGVDYIDFYLLHGLNKSRWPFLKELGVFKWASDKKKEGKIKYLGFSFHDEYEVFHQILEDHEHFTFCQIQYNYMDTDYQAGTKGLKEAAEKGLAVVVMEPIQGGKLAVPPPQKVLEIWNEAENKRKPAEWALQWVWSHPEVSVVLSGMTEMWHVEENLVSADRSGVGVLNNGELALVERVKKAYNELGMIGCTGCRYCMPCPQGVDIPTILEFSNEYQIENRDPAVKTRYWEKITPESAAENCVSCRQCEEACPQQLPIIRLLKNAVRTFETNR